VMNRPSGRIHIPSKGREGGVCAAGEGKEAGGRWRSPPNRSLESRRRGSTLSYQNKRERTHRGEVKKVLFKSIALGIFSFTERKKRARSA